MRKFVQAIATLLFFISLGAAIVWLEAGNGTNISGKTVVLDGDSLEIDGERLRLWGIDAPEYNQMCERDGAEWKCGRESRNALRKLVRNKPLSCRTVGIDKYDRWLVECETSGVSVNEEMVEQGWAVSYGEYLDAEDSARDREAGIWSGTFERPSQWRKERRGDLAATLSAATLETAWMRMKRLAKSLFSN